MLLVGKCLSTAWSFPQVMNGDMLKTDAFQQHQHPDIQYDAKSPLIYAGSSLPYGSHYSYTLVTRRGGHFIENWALAVVAVLQTGKGSEEVLNKANQTNSDSLASFPTHLLLIQAHLANGNRLLCPVSTNLKRQHNQ